MGERSRGLFVGATAVALLFGCSSKDEAKPKPKPKPKAPVAATTTDAAAKVDPHAKARAQTKELRKAVAAWVVAQNKGDFAAYRAMYAPAFTGVLRIGTRVIHQNRERWMRSRSKMFKRGMTVSIANLIVRVGAKAGHARFEQTFASKDGRFKDVGPKVLKVIRSAAGLWLIHSEKMLASHVVHDQPKPLGRHDVPKRLLDKLRKDHKNVGLRFSWAARQRIGKGKASGVVLYMEEHDPHPDKGSYHSGHDPDLEGVFALLKHDSATWSVVASAKIRAGYGTNLSVTQLDVDGDGVKDMLINGRSSRFHHNWQHMVFVSSRYPGIEPIFYNETEGEGGFSSGNTTDVACLVRIGDTVALVRDADKYETEIDIEGPDHKTIKDDHTFTTEVKLWSAKGASKPGSLYGYKVVSAETDSAVLAAWRKRTGAGKKDSPLHEDLTLCGKPADPVFVLHDERGFHLVAGLSLTEKAAKAAAKAAGRPASSVIEM